MQTLTSRPLWICLLGALFLRLVFVFVGFPLLQERWNLRDDGDGYQLIAQSIRDGHYTDVTRGPVYPVFVAMAGSAVGVKFLQALLDTVTCGLVFLLVPLGAGLANRNWKAAALYAVYPFAIWRVAFINKEIVLTFLLMSYVYIQLAAMRDGKLWQWLAAGGLLAVVNLCKPMFLAWPLVILALAFLHRVSILRVVMLFIAMVIVIAPWTWRNYVVTQGAVVPVATEQGGLTTFVGNYQPTLGLWEGSGKVVWMQAVADIRARNAGTSVVELDRVYYRAAMNQIGGNPLKAAEMIVRKCGRFWFLSASRREQWASSIIQLVYLGLFAVGLWRQRPLSSATVVILILIAYVMLIHALSYADMRFSLPVMPLVCVVAAASFHLRERMTAATPSAAR